MRLLSPLRLRGKGAHLHKIRSVLRLDLRGDHGHRLWRQIDAVGSHIGYQPRLVESLSDLHRFSNRKIQLARSLLLQGRGSEWSGRTLLSRLLF